MFGSKNRGTVIAKGLKIVGTVTAEGLVEVGRFGRVQRRHREIGAVAARRPSRTFAYDRDLGRRFDVTGERGGEPVLLHDRGEPVREQRPRVRAESHVRRPSWGRSEPSR